MQRVLATVSVSVAVFVFAFAVVKAGETVDDPSTIAPDSTLINPSGERFRIIADFNLDNISDMAVSDDLSTIGQSGIRFTLWLGDDSGKYYKYESFWTTPHSVSIERRAEGEIRLWTYARVHAQEGLLMCQTFGEETFEKAQSIRIFTGDGGSAIGNATYASVFDNSEVKFRFERIRTDSTGVHRSEY